MTSKPSSADFQVRPSNWVGLEDFERDGMPRALRAHTEVIHAAHFLRIIVLPFLLKNLPVWIVKD